MSRSGRIAATPSPPGTALLAVAACAVFEFVGGILLVLLMIAGAVEPKRWLLYSATLVFVTAGGAVAGILTEARLRTIDWRTPQARTALAAGLAVGTQLLFIAAGGWRSGVTSCLIVPAVAALGALFGCWLVRRGRGRDEGWRARGHR